MSDEEYAKLAHHALALEEQRDALLAQIQTARMLALEEAMTVVGGVLRRTKFWQLVSPQTADQIIEAVRIDLRTIF